MPTRRLTPGTKVITYIRVSDEKQGRSGLALEAQLTSVHAFAQAYGLEVIGEYREIETGTNANGHSCSKPSSTPRRKARSC